MEFEMGGLVGVIGWIFSSFLVIVIVVFLSIVLFVIGVIFVVFVFFLGNILMFGVVGSDVLVEFGGKLFGERFVVVFLNCGIMVN